MSDHAFLAALEKVTAGELNLTDLIANAEILARSGQAPLARQLYRVWAAINASDPFVKFAYFNCAVMDTAAGDHEASVKALQKAIELDPDFSPAYINLGSALERAGRADQAIMQWKALVLRLSAVTASSLDFKLTALKQIARVLSDNQRAALGEGVMLEALELRGDQRDVLEHFMSSRMSQCKWPVAIPFASLTRADLVAGIHPLSLAAFTDDPLLQLGAARRYAEHLVKEGPDLLAQDRRDAPTDLTGRRLRVGYVSSDLRDHAVGYLMAEMLELHDRSKVEVFAYYCGVPASGGLNARIRAAVEHWTDFQGMSDEAAAQQIAEDGIDVLIDVNGHTRDARSAVFARRPAPIIVNWLGYPGTMGTPYHHYVIADDWVIPPDSEMFYSEKVLRLPCYQSNDRRRTIAERPTREAAGLPEDAFVFCCFNGVHKITRFVFERWVRILEATPGSVLWLLETTPEAMANLRAWADRYGIGAQRLVFAPKLANPFHLARYPLADLFLDTSPYGAHTTASDALFMGVPVLTFSGRCFASRVCGSLVRSAGLPDLVCETPDEYEARAIALAQDPGGLQTLRDRLEANRDSCVLFDMDKLTAAIEALYFEMCAAHMRGETPKPNLVNLLDYFQVGLEHDHEAEDLSAKADYLETFKARLAQRHRLRPLLPDNRLWTAEAIAAADGAGRTWTPTPEAPTEAAKPAAERSRKRAAA